MDFIIDIFVEVFFEAFMEVFCKLATWLVPQKPMSHKAQKIIYVIAVLFGALMFILFFIGIALLIESSGKSALGRAFIVLAVAYIVIAVVLKIISAINK